MCDDLKAAGFSLLSLALVLPVACARPGSDPLLFDAGFAASSAAPLGSTAAEATAEPDAPPDTSPDMAEEIPPAHGDETPRRPLVAKEPQRGALVRLEDDRTLRAHAELLHAHFGAPFPSPIEIQSSPAGGDHRAILVLGKPEDRRPLILVLDAQDRILWTKEHPLAGIAPGVREIGLLPGPDGEVAIIWFDAPTKLIALRVWDASGGILADFQLLSVEACDALSALYWPGRGFLVVAAPARGAARAQLLDERGRLAWGEGGKALPWASPSGAPVALAVDTDSSVVLLQVGSPPAPSPSKDVRHALAARYDARGTALWDRPVDLGNVAPQAGGRGRERIQANRATEGIVRVSLPYGSSRRALQVNAVGVVSAASVR